MERILVSQIFSLFILWIKHPHLYCKLYSKYFALIFSLTNSM
jgi:hypothetical protein